MKIFIKAHPNANKERIEKIDSLDKDHYSVWIKEPPVKGKANQAIVNALAEYFKIAPSRVKIISGYTSRQKTIEII